jgi:hypothetical protein
VIVLPRSVREILEHGDELAKRFEDCDPRPEDERDPEAYLALRQAALIRAEAERSVQQAVTHARTSGYSCAPSVRFSGPPPRQLVSGTAPGTRSPLPGADKQRWADGSEDCGQGSAGVGQDSRLSQGAERTDLLLRGQRREGPVGHRDSRGDAVEVTGGGSNTWVATFDPRCVAGRATASPAAR